MKTQMREVALVSSEWISVEDMTKLPRDFNERYSIDVLVTSSILYNRSRQLHGIAQYDFIEDCWVGLHFIPTHYMILPQPPKQ